MIKRKPNRKESSHRGQVHGRRSEQNRRTGQALAEIAIFGAILIFLIGIIVRSHMASSFNHNYKVRAVKFALKQSYEGSQGGAKPNISRNTASVLFVEDRLSPDFNKFNTLDRSPFIVQGSGSFTNMLQYPVDFSDEYKKNLPIMDLYINGQHFEMATAMFVYRKLYKDNAACGAAAVQKDKAELDRCLRQIRESSDGFGGFPRKFYSQVVNGTEDFDAGCSDKCWDLLRRGVATKIIPNAIRPYMAWQWQSKDGRKLDFGSVDEPKYPVFDTSGSLREQTIYYVTDGTDKFDDYQSRPQCLINGNDHLISIIACGDELRKDGYVNDPREDKMKEDIRAVGVMDYQLGDMDQGYDSELTPNAPQPGPTEEMQMFTNIKKDKTSFLEIKDGKLYNPTTNGFVRSLSNKDKVDLISRTIQLSNDTGRMCDKDINPAVQYCVDDEFGCMTGDKFAVTCFSRATRKLFVRSNLMDRSIRKWFTDVTQGL